MKLLSTKMLRKVPEITAIFWIAKILTTAMGESTSDFLANTISPYLAVALGFAVLVIALALQFRARKYIPWVYWFAVAMVAVFGTMAADVLHKQFGVPYWLSTSFFAVVLAGVFAVWYKVEGTLSIHTIVNTRREIFYWLTVMSTFALGTAAGDWTANSLGLGYFASGVLFAGLIVVAAGGRRLRLNEVFTFWFAYIVTRPLGASFADWLGKPAPAGRGWGDGTVSVILTVLIVLCVGYMVLDRKESLAEMRHR
jgi:uncharacterized membrane-anchored protein